MRLRPGAQPRPCAAPDHRGDRFGHLGKHLPGSIGGGEAKETPPGLVGLARKTGRQRGFGDFWQHALVAEGCGEIAVDPIVSPWDIAALLVIVEEAGGRATSLRGKHGIYEGSLVTSNGHLHDQALAALNET